MCPECKRPLVVFELQGIEIDHCLHCLGTWLDAGDLEHFAEVTQTPAGRLSHALATARAQSGACSKRLCPRCRRRLRIIHPGGDADLALEECPLGHGLWFDRGELRQLVHLCTDGGEEAALAAFFGDLFHAELESSALAPGALPEHDPPPRSPR